MFATVYELGEPMRQNLPEYICGVVAYGAVTATNNSASATWTAILTGNLDDKRGPLAMLRIRESAGWANVWNGTTEISANIKVWDGSQEIASNLDFV